DLCIARNGLRCCGARQRDLGSSVHEILLDRGHGRITCRGILCHRLVRRTEHNKQCEAFDCANLLFPHCFPPENGPFSVRPSSACSLLPPSLLTCLHQFVHVRSRPNLENVAVLQRRMLRHELYSMIHVPRLKDENAAELFLGFRIGTVRGCDFAVLPVQGQGGLRTLKRFSTSPVPVGAKMVVVIKACVEHGALFALSHAIEFAFVVVSETDVFHCSSPLPSGWEPAA